ncbi:MAG TPA: L-threonylcarbamoyladenylate synthase [Methylomirabilota bacterium]|nr:L-threonylcarbamoyladenylate synthase [Methylomirabilota bacterium]
MTVTRVVDADRPDPETLRAAAAVLRSGGTVAFPTESFYGLGADALAPEAVRRVFRLKGRPESKPLLVLVDSVERALALAVDADPRARELMGRHWPGPLTLVLRAAPTVPGEVTAGGGTVGLRIPGHAVALGLVRAAGRPVTAPSANPSGGSPPTRAEEVTRSLGPELDLVLDGGVTAGGAGSTVADCTVWPPRILRQGAIYL